MQQLPFTETFLKILLIVGALFCVGGIAIFIICRNKQKETRQKLWLKFWSYVIIVHTIIFSLQVKWAFTPICLLIAIMGFIELLKITSQRQIQLTKLTTLLFTYGTITYFFISFSVTSSPQLILFVYLVVAIFDAFSQITGQLFGRHKLAPSISPAKTIEGAVGGFASAIILAYWLHSALKPSSLNPVFLGVIIALSSFAGDLTSSWFKRLHKVKDFSNWLPGQGGILDRFNSFIVSAAVIFMISRI
jgi:phosphatidate cytidylyltransferase